MEQSATQTTITTDIQEITEDILNVLDARSKDIIVRRFGLKGNTPETLEKIGKEYHVTRERVRQIEANAKKMLAKAEDRLTAIDGLFSEIFKEYGGILTENHIASIVRTKVGMAGEPHLIHFYLEILPAYQHVGKSRQFNPHWRHQPSINPVVEDIAAAAVATLEKKGHPESFETLVQDIRKATPQHEPTFADTKHIEAALTASKHIGISAFGEWGLIVWAETNPRGVSDKAYTVLRHHGKPTHFRDITIMINETGFDAKNANPQTVHNELIKDSRFVLVGRGLYGLKEWGYVTGTVADVLESILKETGKPMSREELVEHVLKQRLVKKNTILLSLQNTKRFKRTDTNQYSLNEKAT